MEPRDSRHSSTTTSSRTTLSMMTTILDTSSPLAALQPPAFSGHWATARPNLDFNNGFLRPGRFSKGIDFKDVGPKKSSSDYFSFRPARGSSPTQSLAVDLSQNFHIDQRFVYILLDKIMARTDPCGTVHSCQHLDALSFPLLC